MSILCGKIHVFTMPKQTISLVSLSRQSDVDKVELSRLWIAVSLSAIHGGRGFEADDMEDCWELRVAWNELTEYGWQGVRTDMPGASSRRRRFAVG
jgi:hypothetical protein